MAAELQRLAADCTVDQVLEVIRDDGAAIVTGLLAPAGLAAVRAEILPYVEATANGRDDFSGRLTTRTGALMARSPACRELVLHPTVLAAAERFLAPYCGRIQLQLSQIIRLRPGQPAQSIHRDRWAWGTYLQSVEPQFNTIWALTDFTAENGATWMAPGSSGWKTITARLQADNRSGATTDSTQVCVDGLSPNQVQSLTSPSHTPNVWSNDTTVDLMWQPASDNGCAGVDGLASKWNLGGTSVPTTINLGPSTTSLFNVARPTSDQVPQEM